MEGLEGSQFCGCGSGREYPACCGNWGAMVYDLVSRRWEVAARSLMGRMADFVISPRWEHQMKRAMMVFWQGTGAGDGLGLEDLESFLDWFLFDFMPDGGRCLAAIFQQENLSELDYWQRQLIHLWPETSLSLYQVSAVAGEAITMTDLLSGMSRVVRRSKELILQTGLLLLARLLPLEQYHWLSPGGVCLPAHFKPELLKILHRERAAAGFADCTAGWNSFMKGYSHRRENWIREVINCSVPQVLVTSEGDPVNPCRARFRISELQEAQRILDHADIFVKARRPVEQSAGLAAVVYDWVFGRGKQHGWQSSSKDYAIGGTLVMIGDRLFLNCLCPQRLARGKRILASLLRPWVRHEADEMVELQDILGEPGTNPAV